jgi:hypothetical protein
MSHLSHNHPVVNASTGRISSYIHSHSKGGNSHTHMNNPAYHILKHKATNMLFKSKK